MDNQELKVAFDEINKKIEQEKANGNDTKSLM